MPWYEVVSGPGLRQGDVLRGCPTFSVPGDLQWPLDGDDIDLVQTDVDLIVLTQSCDLDNDEVEEVMLARVIEWAAVVSAEAARGNQAVKSSKYRKLLVEGNIPGYSLLHKRDGAPGLQWSVVDFHRLLTLPRSFVTSYANTLGPRLRLTSPYREHLAQAFARYFMRAGLPHDAEAFIRDGGDGPGTAATRTASGTAA